MINSALVNNLKSDNLYFYIFNDILKLTDVCFLILNSRPYRLKESFSEHKESIEKHGVVSIVLLVEPTKDRIAEYFVSRGLKACI